MHHAKSPTGTQENRRRIITQGENKEEGGKTTDSKEIFVEFIFCVYFLKPTYKANGMKIIRLICYRLCRIPKEKLYIMSFGFHKVVAHKALAHRNSSICLI